MPSMSDGYYNSVNDLPSRDAYETYARNSEGPSQDIDFIEDPLGGGYMVMPSKRIQLIGNYVTGASSSTDLSNPRVVWEVLPYNGDGNLASCVGSEDLENLISNKGQTIVPPFTELGSTTYLDLYHGPRWGIPRGVKMIAPPDNSAGEAHFEDVPAAPDPEADATASTSEPSASAEAASSPDNFSLAYIAQESICDDIWWTIETKSLAENLVGTPFFIDVALNKPLAVNQSTFFALRIGDLSQTTALGTAKDIIDLVFIDGSPTVLYDWGMPIEQTRPATATSTATTQPTKINLPQMLSWDHQIHRIVILPTAGKLCISVDGENYVYTRIDLGNAITPHTGGEDPISASGTSKGAIPFFPSTKQIRVIGTNSQVVLSVGQVYFPKKAVLHTNLTGGFDPSATVNSTTLALHGSKTGLATEEADPDDPEDEDANTTMVHLPDQEYGTTTLGAFAEKCDGITLESTDTWGSWATGNMHGELLFTLVENTSGGAGGSAIGKHYTISFLSEKARFGTYDDGVVEKPILAPIWFRARGVVKKKLADPPPFPDPLDVSYDVMEITESLQSPDRYHVTHSLDITLYNENGTYDAISENSVPIQVGFGWTDLDGDGEITTNFFTGVTLNSSRTLVAGKETITIHCEDYMFILDATLIMNSPYYDGMDGFNVVQDVVSRANIDAQDDTGGAAHERFFMPSGYSFLQPAKRYESRESLKSCIVDVCGMGAKVVYFDGDGLLHYDHIQGGIAFSRPASDIDAAVWYVSDPQFATDKTLVLDEKRTETKLNSTVNRIVVKSVGRMDRTIIRVSQTASAESNRLSYRKTMFASVPSLGSYDATIKYLENLKPIVFKAIRGITIKTADDTLVLPMSFMSVDGEKYRIMSINRSIRADDNSIATTLTGEWMGDYDPS